MTDWKPGDVADGHVLGDDLVWRPVEEAVPPPSSGLPKAQPKNLKWWFGATDEQRALRQNMKNGEWWRGEIAAQQERSGGTDEGSKRAADRLLGSPISDDAVKSLAEGEAAAGRLLIDESFGGRRVRIYENGFVRVSGFTTHLSAPFEKLLAVEYDPTIQTKTAPGRLAAGVLTMGMNMLASSQRGVLFLTLTTTADTHVIQDQASDGAIQTGKKLAAAAERVLKMTASASTFTSGATGVESGTHESQDAASRLRQAKSLLEEGLISEEEFSAIRAGLVDRL